MRDDAQVVVIGGGVVGASVLYHLTKAGWDGLVLLERAELTNGSTWHAAGGMHTLNGDPNVAALQQYTIELYREIQEISGQDCGIHLTGGVMLADTAERLDWLAMADARGRYLGMDTTMISTADAKDLFPLLDESRFVGALYDPMEGRVDPSGVTHAYAIAARKAGAEIERHCMVESIDPTPDGRWRLATTKGDIVTDHVVNAAGLWAREVGRMVGLELPVLAMEHMYLITEPIPEVAAYSRDRGARMVGVMDFGGEMYLHQEGDGMLVGTYERAGVPWSPDDTPWDFGPELLTPDLDRIAPSLAVGFEHYPALADVGIRNVVNGPFTFAPDGNPLVGPVPGLRNYWAACGVMAGLSQGGGVGLALANWMTDGDPGLDVWGMDVARFGDWATKAYTNAKVRENYSRRFRITFPNEELPAARPLLTTPIHHRLTEQNAVWGAAYGLEHALWFQREGEEPLETITYRRSNAFDRVAEECRAVRESAGLLEISNFAKYFVDGSGARRWLDGLMANTLPARGRLGLTPMLNEAGKLIGDFTVGDLGEGRFIVFGSGIAEKYHMRWFLDHLPDDGSVTVSPAGLSMVGLAIAGPSARMILQQLTDADLAPEAFPFLAIREIDVGMTPALVGRISFTGELGYEIWVAPEYQARLFDDLVGAGSDHGLRLYGARALDSLRLEKGFGSWATEYRNVYDPFEAGLDRFVRLDKGRFIGRDAAIARSAEGPGRRLVTMVVDADDADVSGDEPILHDGETVGWVTSGGFGHWVGRSIALGYVPTEIRDGTDRLAVEILGDRRPATIQARPLHDPTGARMRS